MNVTNYTFTDVGFASIISQNLRHSFLTGDAHRHANRSRSGADAMRAFKCVRARSSEEFRRWQSQ
jgi:hypothetical protein